MCEKCARHISKAKLPLGKIKFFAHYIDTHKYPDIPLFSDKSSNLAIEGFVWKIRRAKTNKKKYSRKHGREVRQRFAKP